VIDDDQNSASTEIDEIDAGSSEDYIVPDETGMPKRESGRQTPTRGSFKVPEGQGEPLRPETRLRMESQFGHNFEWVTIHTGSDAALSARQIGAHAYTIGGSIFFNEGQYQPETGEGQKLIAHELAHVIQQTSGLLRQVDNQLDSQSNNNPNTNIETTDAGIDNVTGMVTSQPAKKGGRGNVCSSGSCPQGKRKQAVRNDCQSSGPVDQSNFIDQLTVSLSGQTVDVHWSGGKIESWPCSPRPSVTPKGSDVVGTKCSIKHTNRSRDGMAWFTGFSSQGLRIGFHDSQRVGTGIFSHGCVRVCCDKAEIINQNTWSGKTAINVS